MARCSARRPSRRVAGIKAALRAIGQLGDPDVLMLLAGDGPARAELETFAQEHCAGRAHFAGVLADPRPAYAAADVLVGRGTTVARAMAHGVATIVQDEATHPCLVEPSRFAYYESEEFVSVPDHARWRVVADEARHRTVRWRRQRARTALG